MGRYTDQPTLNLGLLTPEDATYDVRGGATEGGRNGLGESASMDMSGGGMVVASIEDCHIQDPVHYQYINWLGARLNGSYRFINVPIITDFYGPFLRVNGIARTYQAGIPHSDGSTFLDGATYQQATVWGEIIEAAAVNAGVIRMRVFRASRRFEFSDWFSINHAIRGHRAYRYWDVLASSDAVAEVAPGLTEPVQVYTLAISPPLREAIPAGTAVRISRPLFVAKFSADFTLPSKSVAFHVTKQSLQFTEALL